LKPKNILVFGDYDVDGTTATSCFFLFENLLPQYRYLFRIVMLGYGISFKGIDLQMTMALR
jgi:single-stranded DNA-specific DHH superfamily exonuclease